MEKSIKEAVDNAMKKWKASSEQAGTTKGGNTNAFGDRAIGNQLIGTTLTPELLAVLLQGAAVKGTQDRKTGIVGQGRATLICYRCGLEGHWANACTNPKNPQLVNQQAQLTGAKPCAHCGRYGHTDNMCWTKEGNAHL